MAMIVECAVVLSVLAASSSPAVPAFAMTAQLVPAVPDGRRPAVCTEQYAPVCGRLDNVTKTYSNQCYARAAGATVIAQGRCSGAVTPPGPR